MTPEKRADSGRSIEIGEEAILKISKEIAIKFIEMGRITPATFDESFKNIHTTIRSTVGKE
ncbi:MAG: hypothetical protein ABR523_04760 [Desulfurivibrionaceae bacterium]